MLKKIITDWPLWVLVIFNLYLLDYYYKHPLEVATIIFLYWAQSVLIGVVNFLNILTLPNKKPEITTISALPQNDSFGGKGCMAFFFLFHYGAFHVGYLVFILVKIDGKIDFDFVKIGVAILCCNLIVDFIRKKIQQQNHNQHINAGKIFIGPYIRIVPMHLTIILPEFFKVSNFTVFIILKILMDLLMHFATSDHYRSGNRPASLSSEL